MVEAIGLRRVRQDANMVSDLLSVPGPRVHSTRQWYVQHTISEGYFRLPNGIASQISSGRITGKIRSATLFCKLLVLMSRSPRLLTWIYASNRGQKCHGSQHFIRNLCCRAG